MLPDQKEQVLAKLRNFCAKAERCRDDVRRKIPEELVDQSDQILEELESEGFLDEGRYVRAFVRDKVSLSGWGPHKIRFTLVRKGLRAEEIDNALRQIAAEELETKLADWIPDNAPDPYSKEGAKLLRRLLRRGFPLEMILKTMRNKKSY